MSGKGDRYRPVDRKKFDANYDRIFRKDTPNEATAPQAPADGTTPTSTGPQDPEACSCGSQSVGDCTPPAPESECRVAKNPDTRPTPEPSDNQQPS